MEEHERPNDKLNRRAREMLQNAMRVAFDKADCHDRNQNGNLCYRMPPFGTLICGMPQAVIRMAFLGAECQSCGILERRMPELWQFVESNAIAWHSSAWIAIGLVTEGLSQPRSSLQNTVRPYSPSVSHQSLARWYRVSADCGDNAPS